MSENDDTQADEVESPPRRLTRRELALRRAAPEMAQAEAELAILRKRRETRRKESRTPKRRR